MIEFAGAGAQALAWLHAVGGSSRTILEATDRYAAAALSEAIGFSPAQYTSPGVARTLAATAYLRARRLAAPEDRVAGIGCTATIATNRTKRGDHRCYIAICEARGITGYGLSLIKGARSRQAEEDLVSLLMIKALADAWGVEEAPLPDFGETEALHRHFISAEPLHQLLQGAVDWVAISPEGQLTAGQRRPGVALLSGSFNPLHQGHRQMVQVAAQRLHHEAFFELPLVNADKDPIDPAETFRRSGQFADFAPLLLTRSPLFSQKAKIFPDSVFILGVDTVERLLQLRFYNDDPAQMLASLDEFREAGCRFLVAGRVRPEDNRFITLDDIAIPTEYDDLFEQIPEADFRVDLSSTKLRQSDS